MNVYRNYMRLRQVKDPVLTRPDLLSDKFFQQKCWFTVLFFFFLMYVTQYRVARGCTRVMLSMF